MHARRNDKNPQGNPSSNPTHFTAALTPHMTSCSAIIQSDGSVRAHASQHAQMSPIHGQGGRPARLWKRAQLGTLIGRTHADPQHRAAYAGTSPYKVLGLPGAPTPPQPISQPTCRTLQHHEPVRHGHSLRAPELMAPTYFHATTAHRESVSQTSQAPKQRVNTASSPGAEKSDPFLSGLRFVVIPNRKADAAESWLPLQNGSHFSTPRETLPTVHGIRTRSLEPTARADGVACNMGPVQRRKREASL